MQGVLQMEFRRCPLLPCAHLPYTHTLWEGENHDIIKKNQISYAIWRRGKLQENTKGIRRYSSFCRLLTVAKQNARQGHFSGVSGPPLALWIPLSNQSNPIAACNLTVIKLTVLSPAVKRVVSSAMEAHRILP